MSQRRRAAFPSFVFSGLDSALTYLVDMLDHVLRLYHRWYASSSTLPDPESQLIKSTTEQHYGLGIRRGKLSEDVIQGQMHVR